MSIINSQPRIGAAGQSTGYKIERSLRFNSADSAYLNRTPASAGNRKTWTWSGWVKRSGLPAAGVPLFGAQIGAAFQYLCFGGSSLTALTTDALCLFSASGENYSVQSAAVYRDVSAWYHIVCAVDTTQATAANRVKLYVNGSEVSYGTSTYPTQNLDTYMNSANSNLIGLAPSIYFQGYMTEINFIDGQALTPSSFGETDTDTGVWKPKAYSGSYGTNGFYLKFADNSGTTSTTLGKDSSGNGNNWTPNNFSVTAGAGNDSLVDTPTPYGTDTGAGGEVRGNYATLNPTIPPLTSQATTVISNGNLDFSVTQQNGSFGAAFSTIGVSSGKWYFEYLATNIRTSTYVGFFNSGNFAGYNGGTTGIGAPSDAYARAYSGYIINNNGVLVSGLSTFTDGDIVMCAVDFDAGKMWFGVNGTWDSSGNPGAGTNQTASFTPGGKTYVFAVSGYANTGVGVVNGTANFGQRPFAYTAPSGFKALCTQNLPTPTIGATSATRADDYFNTVLYTGNGNATAQAITGVGFQPDFVWLKARSQTYEHIWNDAVRGAGKILYSSLTNAEATVSNFVSFDSDGFTVNAAGGASSFNQNGTTYASWNWKANGAGSSNTAGSITSTVSANTTAGFSIVTYTGNGTSGATVGHGCLVNGAATTPSMVILKRRDAVSNWQVKHVSLNANQNLELNSTAAVDTAPGSGYISAISSTTLTLLNGGSAITNVNANTGTYLAYCFAPVAGYSAFGSYTGNGSTDGPFIYTGFRPAWVMWKNSTSASQWILFDVKRWTYNIMNGYLEPNTSDAENTGSAASGVFDILSNGFKLRVTGTDYNQSGNTYVYAAFAEVPTKFSLAR